MTSGPAVPGHVPDECVWDRDFAGFLRELDDPYLAGARLHDGPDIIWATSASYAIPSWIFTRHGLVEEAFADAAKFLSARGPIIDAVLDPSWMMLPVEADKPLNQQYRMLMHPFFTPAAINRRSTQIYELCDTLIDEFLEAGCCEFIRDFASILPNAIAISLLGMPQDMLGQFLDWT